jgi:hypothetical protein
VSAEAESGREASRQPTAICNNSLQRQQSVEHNLKLRQNLSFTVSF